MIAKDPSEILYSSQVDILRDNFDEGTADADKMGFKDYCIAEITDKMLTREFKPVYLSLLDDIMSYDIRDRLIFARELLISFSSKYDISIFVIFDLMGQTLDISVNSEEDIINILSFIEFIEYNCSDVFSEFLSSIFNENIFTEEKIKNLIEKGGIDFLKNFIDFVKDNDDKFPKLFKGLIPLLTAEVLKDMIIKISFNNWDEIFIETKRKFYMKIKT